MAAQKKLEKNSEYAKYDVDGDGIVTDEELEIDERLMRLENEDKRQDAQRNMAWFASQGWRCSPATITARPITQGYCGSLKSHISFV